MAWLEARYGRLGRARRIPYRGAELIRVEPIELFSVGTVRVLLDLLYDGEDHVCTPCPEGDRCIFWTIREEHCSALHKAGYRWWPEGADAEVDPVYPGGARPAMLITKEDR